MKKLNNILTLIDNTFGDFALPKLYYYQKKLIQQQNIKIEKKIADKDKNLIQILQIRDTK